MPLNFFAKEYKLSDKQFKKLNMHEAKLLDWVCLEAPLKADTEMNKILGKGWREFPFKSLCDILQFRFGDTFHNPEAAFNYDTWNPLLHLGRTLNNDQVKFLEEYNFLPHKFAAAEEELTLLESRLKTLEIEAQEHFQRNDDENHRYVLSKVTKLKARKKLLEEQMQIWQKANPDGGNPASANEYLSTYVELREWLEYNEEAAIRKSQMFVIMMQQMKSALAQARAGKTFNHEEFGHYNERMRRYEERRKARLKAEGKSSLVGGLFANSSTYEENKAKTKTSTTKKPEPVKEDTVIITNTKAFSSKIRLAETAPVEELEPAEHIPVFNEAIQQPETRTRVITKTQTTILEIKNEQQVDVLEIIAEPKRVVLNRMGNKGNPMDDYETIRKKMIENKKQSTNSTEKSSKISKIVLTIAAVALIAMLYFFLR